MAQISVDLILYAKNFNNDLKLAQKEIRAFEAVIKPTTKAFADMGAGLTSLGKTAIVGLTAPIAAVAGLGLAFNAMQEQATVAFTTMLGSGQKAQFFLEDLKDFAAKTPFNFPDLVNAAQRLMAMGFAAEEVKPLLITVGDAVAGLGKGSAEIDRVTLALGQMSGRGKVATQEMNQLTEVGIKGWEILAEGMGITEAKLRDLVERGMVPAGQAIKILTAGMNEEFGGMMAKQAETFNGLISTIKDQSRFIAGELTSGLFDILKGPARAAAEALDGVRESIKGWSSETKAAVAVVAGLAAAAGPLLYVAGTLATSISTLIPAVVKFGTTLGILAPTAAGITAALGTVASVAAGVGGALAALYIGKQVSDWMGWTPVIKEVASELWETAKAAGGFLVEMGKIAGSTVVGILKGMASEVRDFAYGLRDLARAAIDSASEISIFLGLGSDSRWDELGYAIEHPIDMALTAVRTSLAITKATMKQFTDDGIAAMGPMTVGQQMFSKAVSDSAKAALFAATDMSQANKVRLLADQAAAEAAAEHKKVIDGLLKSFDKEQDEARNTEVVLKILEARHTSGSEISRVMGKSIEGLRDALVEAGAVVPPLIAKHANLHEAYTKGREATKAFELALKDNEKGAAVAALTMASYGDKLRLVPTWTKDAATGVTSVTYALTNSGIIAQQARDHWVAAMTSMKEPAAAAFVGINAIGGAYDDSAGKALLFGTIVTEAGEIHAKEMDKQAKQRGKDDDERTKALEKYRGLVAQNSGLIASSLQNDSLTFGNAVSVMLGRVHDGALTAGNVFKKMGSDILGEFLGPVKTAFDSLFDSLLEATIMPFARKAGEAIAGLFGVGSGSSSGPNLGNVRGLIEDFNKAFGGGGSAAGGAAGGLGGSGGVGGLAGKLNPIGAITGIVNDAIDIYNKTIGQIGAGREAADQIVKSQNAFGDAVKKLVDSTDMGSLSGVTSTQKLLDQLWGDFQANMDRFAATDPNNQKVANQAFATLMPWITDIRAGLERGIAALGGGDSAASVGNTALVRLAEVAQEQRSLIWQTMNTIVGQLGTIYESGLLGIQKQLGSIGAANISYTPIASLAVGDPFIERQGLYELHRGERVVPAAQNRAGMMGGGGVSVGDIHIHIDNRGEKNMDEEKLATLVVKKAIRMIGDNREGSRRGLQHALDPNRLVWNT